MQRNSQTKDFQDLSDTQKEEIRVGLAHVYTETFSSGAFYSSSFCDIKKDLKTIVSPYNFQNDWLR
jgi:hypothetical protein